ncbi:MAG: amidinotransferase [Mucilaginibacter sp.]|nr:amidinotransferase [Mucilaginibacter sp.]
MANDAKQMKNNQSTSNILMIRPVSFGYNEQTAESNAFQTRDSNQKQVQASALAEFDGFVNILKENGVNVTVIEDTLEPHTPDSIFPNNWVSFHTDGNVFLYPMQAGNRRLERREDIINQLEDTFKVKHVIDLSRFEHEGKFLEGTGSMVLDRENKIVYACLSPRTDENVLNIFCEQSGYRPVIFEAKDEQGLAIYHTNVLMCIGSKFAVVCLDSIADHVERQLVILSIINNDKELIDITYDQMNHFAGNMLEVKNKNGESLIVMSQSAYSSLTDEQITTLTKYGKLVYADLRTIENNGGGSARCMMAEVHLPLA